MRVYIKTDPEDQTLKRPAFHGDAGYDIVAFEEPEIIGEEIRKGVYSSIDYIQYETNVSVAPENESEFYSLVYPRSSVSKYNLILANSVGVVDSGYRDSIKLRFKYVVQPEDLVIKTSGSKTSIGAKVNVNKIYKKGEKIGQVVFVPHNKPLVEFTNSLPMSDRGLGGFGSTGQ